MVNICLVDAYTRGQFRQLSKHTFSISLKRLKWNKCLTNLSDKVHFGDYHKPQISVPLRDLMLANRDVSVANPQIQSEILRDLHPLRFI